MSSYNPKEIEEKGIDEGERRDEFKFRDDGNEKKLYVLDMFPYPSGSGLHVGHLKGYLATDIWARFSVMKGYTVFHPMGGDAFGLPAEQYAIKTGNSPETFTNKNIDNFRKQLKRLMLSYDFSREVNTSDPEYYKHTQGIFSEMYRDGLAELRDTQVNGCEELNTVLSEEEIIDGEDGKRYSERGNYEVTPKVMKQGVLRITDYSEELLEDLKLLDGPDNIKKIQENGIGKNFKYVYNFRFKNVSYPLYLKHASSIRKLKAIGIHEFSKLSSVLGVSKLNLGNKELLPVKLANDFGHTKKGQALKIDARLEKSFDLCFLWNADFRSDDLVPLFSSEGGEDDFFNPEVEDGYLKEYDAKPSATYRLKDGVFSRQRYGGEPIPILYDESGNIFLDEDLPVVLPKSVDYSIKRNGLSPLSNDEEGLKVRKNNQEFIRETNTMPNGAGSSGYFIAYLLKKEDGTYYDLNSEKAKEILDRGLPVDIYVGGQEHAAMHLLYARFGHKFLYKKGIVSTKEPFKTLFNQGLVLGSDGSKMSKSKGNYVGIDEIIDSYGSDALRVYEAFSGPTQLSFKGEDDGIKGSQKGLNKVYVFFNNLDDFQNIDQDREVSNLENSLIRSIEKVIPSLKINLGVSELMIFLNEIQKLEKYHNKALNSFVQILSFYAPALAEEIGTTVLGNKESLFRSKWPELNDVEQIHGLEYKVFVNGKFKFLIEISRFEADSDDHLSTLVVSQLTERKIDLIIEDVSVNHEKNVILVKARSAEE